MQNQSSFEGLLPAWQMATFRLYPPMAELGEGERDREERDREQEEASCPPSLLIKTLSLFTRLHPWRFSLSLIASRSHHTGD